MENLIKYSGNDIGIYVHWPFCISKCHYCCFNSYVMEPPENFIQKYISNLNLYKELLFNKNLISVYFGGGTPSLMDIAAINDILSEINKIIPIKNSTEITIEANPETVSKQKLFDFKNAGINRISYGMQSFSDEILLLLGRKNTSKKNREIIELTKNIFDNYSIDLIYAIPSQKNWPKELETALGICKDIPHVSLYELSIEKHSYFYDKYKDYSPPDFFDITHSIMSQHGFDHYEISNYARNKLFSKHNMLYWLYNDFIGIGAGAFGRITENGKRYETKEENIIQKWLKASPIKTAISKRHQDIEKLLMGLRINNWVQIEKMDLNNDRLNYFIENGYLEQDENYIRSTYNGKKILNYILQEITN